MCCWLWSTGDYCHLEGIDYIFDAMQLLNVSPCHIDNSSVKEEGTSMVEESKCFSATSNPLLYTGMHVGEVGNLHFGICLNTPHALKGFR